MNPLKTIENSPTAAYKKVAEGALLIDVREKDEVVKLAFDMPNILYIPLTELEHQYMELPKDKELIIVCRGGVRSLRAALFLIENGYTKVLSMQDGILGWSKNGFPTKTSAAPALDHNEAENCCRTTSTSSNSCCNSSSKVELTCCKTK